MFAENDARSYSSLASNLQMDELTKEKKLFFFVLLFFARFFVFGLGFFGELFGGGEVLEQSLGVGASLLDLLLSGSHQFFQRLGHAVGQSVAQLRVKLGPILRLFANHIPG